MLEFVVAQAPRRPARPSFRQAAGCSKLSDLGSPPTPGTAGRSASRASTRAAPPTVTPSGPLAAAGGTTLAENDTTTTDQYPPVIYAGFVWAQLHGRCGATDRNHRWCIWVPQRHERLHGSGARGRQGQRPHRNSWVAHDHTSLRRVRRAQARARGVRDWVCRRRSAPRGDRRVRGRFAECSIKPERCSPFYRAGGLLARREPTPQRVATGPKRRLSYGYSAITV